MVTSWVSQASFEPLLYHFHSDVISCLLLLLLQWHGCQLGEPGQL
jgi:hypothetical protein